ncbi:hypothetical protein [Nitrososphaera sp.]|uniref:hypothetical protein n=1 Tax=Nitrososphaera sp. TaxID=1971748 RepID=UPI00307E9683
MTTASPQSKKELSEAEAWEILKPVCRELFELVNEKMLGFVSASEEGNGSFTIRLKSSRLHFASRGFKDSIGDVEYGEGMLRVGLRANGRPGNVFVELAA